MNNVEIAVTHEIKLGRESAWVKAGVSLETEPHESTEEAFDRASKLVARKVLDAIDVTVGSVRNYEGKSK